MMDFSGSNRGFFFVRYTCKEDAKRACKELDNFEIRPHKRLGVLMSLDNNKLWLSGIPNGATQEDIKVIIALEENEVSFLHNSYYCDSWFQLFPPHGPIN